MDRGFDDNLVFLTSDEAHRLIAAAKPGRDRLLVELLWQSGARASEAIHLEAANVNVAECWIALPNLKQRRDRLKQLFIKGDLCRRLVEFATANGEYKVFLISRWTAWRIVKRAATKAGIIKVQGNKVSAAWTHTLRHSCAKNLLDQGWPLPAVQRHLGHASLATTQVYTRMSTAEMRVLGEKVRY